MIAEMNLIKEPII